MKYKKKTSSFLWVSIVIAITLIVFLYNLTYNSPKNMNSTQEDAEGYVAELETFWNGYDYYFNVVCSDADNTNLLNSVSPIDEFALSNNILTCTSHGLGSSILNTYLIIGNQTEIDSSYTVFVLLDGYLCNIKCSSEMNTNFAPIYESTIQDEPVFIPIEVYCERLSSKSTHEIAFFVCFDHLESGIKSSPTTLSLCKPLSIGDGNSLPMESRSWAEPSNIYIEYNDEENYFTQNSKYLDDHKYELNRYAPTYIVCNGKVNENLLIYFLVDSKLLFDEYGIPVCIEGSSTETNPFVCNISDLLNDIETPASVVALVLNYPTSGEGLCAISDTTIYTLTE